jgi:hypothetical protein
VLLSIPPPTTTLDRLVKLDRKKEIEEGNDGDHAKATITTARRSKNRQLCLSPALFI